MTERHLVIWWDDVVVGTLSQDRHGDLRFVYAGAWLVSDRTRLLSRSLPLRAETFDRRESRPFFGGLLPEADQRDAVAGALGVSRQNESALLEGLGGDVAGALTLLPEGLIPLSPSTENNTALTDDALATLLEELTERPMMAGVQGLRLSLAGAQVKLLVVLIDGKPALPAIGQPTTHIIKPEIRRFPGSV